MATVKEGVCAIVVTFNRVNDLRRCIKALLDQSKPLDGIIIFDNGIADKTVEMLKNIGLLTADFDVNVVTAHKNSIHVTIKGHEIRVVYIDSEHNVGGAGGFHYGSKEAYEMDFQWLWLLDDDGMPDIDALANIMLKANNTSVLNSLVLNVDNPDQTSFKIGNTYNVRDIISRSVNGLIDDISPFNGTLIHHDIIKSIGLPDQRFFICGDERDYVIRLKNNNIPCVSVVDSKVFHRGGDKNDNSKLFSFYFPIFLFEWKSYYKIRNRAYIYITYNNWFIAILKNIKLLFAILLSAVRSKSIEALNLFLRGFKDGLTGKLGKRVIPWEK